MTDEIHVSTKDRPGDYDALETAKADEPIFVVQGGEPLGPPTVLHWVDLARERARALVFGSKDMDPAERATYKPTAEQQAQADKLLGKATQAEEVAWAMKAYQRGEQPVAETRARYNDALVVADDSTAGVATRKALISSVGRLNNAAAEANQVAELLVKLEVHEDAQGHIAHGIELLRKAAAEIEPRRGHERS